MKIDVPRPPTGGSSGGGPQRPPPTPTPLTPTNQNGGGRNWSWLRKYRSWIIGVLLVVAIVLLDRFAFNGYLRGLLNTLLLQPLSTIVVATLVIAALVLGNMLLVALIAYSLAGPRAKDDSRPPRNLFFTIVKEGQAKAVMRNGQFHRMIMSYGGHKFARMGETLEVKIPESDDIYPVTVGGPAVRFRFTRKFIADTKTTMEFREVRIRDWQVVPDKWVRMDSCRSGTTGHREEQNFDPHPTDAKKFGTLKPAVRFWKAREEERPENLQKPWYSWAIKMLGFIKGLRWVGIPPFYTVHTYKFEWTSLEQVAYRGTEPVREVGKEALGPVKRTKVTNFKDLDYILVQPDVYVATLEDVETKQGIPVHVDLALTTQVITPPDALFRVQKWLETMTSQLEATLRVFVGAHDIEQLFQTGAEDKSVTAPEILMEDRRIRTRLEEIENRFGVKINLLQIHALNPTGTYGNLLTKEYEGEQEGKKIKRIALARREAVAAEYEPIAAHGRLGVLIRQAEALEKLSGLRAIGGQLTTIGEDVSRPDEKPPGGDPKKGGK